MNSDIIIDKINKIKNKEFIVTKTNLDSFLNEIPKATILKEKELYKILLILLLESDKRIKKNISVHAMAVYDTDTCLIKTRLIETYIKSDSLKDNNNFESIDNRFMIYLPFIEFTSNKVYQFLFSEKQQKNILDKGYRSKISMINLLFNFIKNFKTEKNITKTNELIISILKNTKKDLTTSKSFRRSILYNTNLLEMLSDECLTLIFRLCSTSADKNIELLRTFSVDFIENKYSILRHTIITKLVIVNLLFKYKRHGLGLTDYYKFATKSFIEKTLLDMSDEEFNSLSLEHCRIILKDIGYNLSDRIFLTKKRSDSFKKLLDENPKLKMKFL